MRLSSTAFTHTSTAAFGVAVAGYTAIRIVSYVGPDVTHLVSPPSPAPHAQASDVLAGGADIGHVPGLEARAALSQRPADDSSAGGATEVSAAVASASGKQQRTDDGSAHWSGVRSEGSTDDSASTDDSTSTTWAENGDASTADDSARTDSWTHDDPATTDPSSTDPSSTDRSTTSDELDD